MTVFVIDPTAELATVPVTVNVAVPPVARSIEARTLLEPEAGQAPSTTTHVHDAPSNDTGSTSVTDAPNTSDGPALDTTIV